MTQGSERVTRGRIVRTLESLRPVVPFLVALTVAAVAIAAIAAPSYHSDTRDPNDTRGLLDVRRVRLDHEGRTEVTVITFA